MPIAFRQNACLVLVSLIGLDSWQWGKRDWEKESRAFSPLASAVEEITEEF
jgi:hypothetical protein